PMASPTRTAPSTTGQILRRNRGSCIDDPSNTHTRRRGEHRKVIRGQAPQRETPAITTCRGAGYARRVGSKTDWSGNLFPRSNTRAVMLSHRLKSESFECGNGDLLHRFREP